MQHIGIEITNDSLTEVNKSDVNFAKILSFVWQNCSKEEYPWLWGVDAYGLTLINLIQSENFKTELLKIYDLIQDSDLKHEVRMVIDFIDENLKDLRYLKFFGD